jgi:hypothetical protein
MPSQVEGRTSAATVAWLNVQPESWRAGITHVTIDLSAAYAKAVREALPDAVLVVDRFHAVQLGNDMLTQVRQRVIRETQGRRGRETNPAWASRPRLLTVPERLRPETFARMWNSLIDTGDAGVQILAAYVVKEELRALLNLSGTNPERPIIRSRLDSFYRQAAATDAPEAHRLAATIEASGQRSKQSPLPATPTPDPVSGSWAQTGFPRRVSSIPSTFTGSSGAARRTRTCATNAAWTMGPGAVMCCGLRDASLLLGGSPAELGPQPCRQPRAGPDRGQRLGQRGPPTEPLPPASSTLVPDQPQSVPP